MKIETSSGERPGLSSLRTIVLYRWNAFLPDNAKDLGQCSSQFLTDYTSADVYYLSGDSGNSWLEFVEYDYAWKPKDLRVPKATYFDRSTQNIALDEENNYKSDVLGALEELIIPSSSDSEPVFEDKFFSVVSNGSKNIIYLDLPGSEGPGYYGVSRIEIYDSYIRQNHNIEGRKNTFIDYSVLKALGYSGVEPVLTITLGPERDCDQNRKSSVRFYYRESDLSGNKPIYDIPEFREPSGWYSMLREIQSKKLLTLIMDSSGTLADINLSYISWQSLEDPNRNQHSYSLQNSEFWATRDFMKPYKTSGSLVFDRRSGVLLGTEKIEETPIKDRRVSQLGSVFRERRVYKEGDRVSALGKTYSSVLDGNLGENPVYSRYWIPSEDLLETLTPDYVHFEIQGNMKMGGSIKPEGRVSYRYGKRVPLVITPAPRYDLKSLRVGNSRPVLSEIYDPRTGSYRYVLDTSKYKPGETIKVYPEFSQKQACIKLGYPITITDNFGEGPKSLELSSLTELASNLGFQVSFYRCKGKWNKDMKPIRNMIGEDGTGTVVGIYPKDSSELRNLVMVVTGDSKYQVTSVMTTPLLGSGSESYIEPVRIDGADVYILINSTDTNLGDDISRNVVMTVTAKKYEVQVSQENTDISKTGSYVYYDSNFSVDFIPGTDYQFDEARITIGESVYSGNSDITDGTGRLLGKITISKDGIYTLKVFGIRDNVKIHLISRENENK